MQHRVCRMPLVNALLAISAQICAALRHQQVALSLPAGMYVQVDTGAKKVVRSRLHAPSALLQRLEDRHPLMHAWRVLRAIIVIALVYRLRQPCVTRATGVREVLRWRGPMPQYVPPGQPALLEVYRLLPVRLEGTSHLRAVVVVCLVWLGIIVMGQCHRRTRHVQLGATVRRVARRRARAATGHSRCRQGRAAATSVMLASTARMQIDR